MARKLTRSRFSWQRLMVLLLIAYLLLAGFLFLRADSLMFHPPQPASYRDTPEIIKIPVTERDRISAIYLPSKNPPAQTIVYIHGNAEDLGEVRPILDRWHDWGYGVFAYDYRGYGTSDGQPSEQNIYGDIDRVYAYLTEGLKIPPRHLIIYGHSIGGASATEIASKKPVGGLVLESTITSAARAVFRWPILPFDRLPNIDKIKRVGCPILVIHGRKDRMVPFWHGERLLAAARSPKLSLWVDNADHDDILWVSGDRHRQMMAALIEQIDR
jgi:abhydrolase domain-containing protein 17